MFAAMQEDVRRTAHGLPYGDDRGDSMILVTIMPARGAISLSVPRNCTPAAKCRLIQSMFKSVAQAIHRKSCAAVAREKGLRIDSLAPAAFFVSASSFGCEAHSAVCRDKPVLTMARQPMRGDTGGILVPNPYFESIESWIKQSVRIRRVATLTPLESRLPKAVWRGKLTAGTVERAVALSRAGKAGEQSLSDLQCRQNVSLPPLRVGDVARMVAVTRSCMHSSLLDIKLLPAPGADDDPVLSRGARLLADCWMRSARPHPASRGGCNDTSMVGAWMRHEDFVRFQVSLSLPGQTRGSYSRHLNHAWMFGSPVVIVRSATPEFTSWRTLSARAKGDRRLQVLRPRSDFQRVFLEDEPWVNWSKALFEEWYYPALRPNGTHVEVNTHTLIATVQALVANTTSAQHWRAALAAGARDVYEHLLCPCCLVEYFSRVFAAISRQQGKTESKLRDRVERMAREDDSRIHYTYYFSRPR